MGWEPEYEERFPEWRSSDGALKERGTSFPEKEPGDGRETAEPMPGYESSENEKKQNETPRKLWELSSSYGSLAIGKNKKKQLVIVNSQRRTKKLHSLTPESKTLRSETSMKIPLIAGEFRFNEDWNRREESAYSYQLEADHSPDYLMRKMKELGDKRTLKVQENVNPFIELNGEKEELAYLREKAAELAGTPKRDAEAERALRSRIQFLTTALADKERYRTKLYTKLPQLMEDARREEPGHWDFIRPWREKPETDGDEGAEGAGDAPPTDNHEIKPEEGSS